VLVMYRGLSAVPRTTGPVVVLLIVFDIGLFSIVSRRHWWPKLVQDVTEPIHYRFKDGDDRFQMLPIMAITEPRPVIEFLRHLRVARRLLQASIVLGIDATLVEALADEAQHTTHAA
jgi:hypothetical protein